MSSARREAVISKVLKKLYSEEVPCTSHLQVPSLQSESIPKTITAAIRQNEVEVVQFRAECSTDGEKGIPNNMTIYTASLPPEDYVPSSQNDCKSLSTEDSESNDNTEGDLLLGTRKRRRKKKKANVTQAALENRPNIQQNHFHSQISDAGTINKNKKRKLQRKRQKERMKAAGLLTKARAVDFLYQPEGDLERDTVKYPNEKTTEDDQRKMSVNLLDFLQATQEIYYTDRKATSAASSLSLGTILEILSQIKTGEIPSSDITVLHHLKSLLLLQDIERLKDALDDFKEHSSLPIDSRSSVCMMENDANVLEVRTGWITLSS
ncbi:hypothetical protein FKM82_011171 [Ascaphus truei]